MTSAETSLAFFRRLQQLINKIHATHDIDGIPPELSAELCDLFDCDRLTVYQLSGDRTCLVSKIKTGLAAFKQLKLPVTKHSIAGYAALSGRMLNLQDVYDESELHRIDAELQHQHGVDRRTGYRARQMLVSPIADHQGAVRGVLQLINNRNGGPFQALAEEGVQYICDALAIAMGPHPAAAPAPQADQPRPDATLATATAVAINIATGRLIATAAECGLTGVQVTTAIGSGGEALLTITAALRPRS